MSEVTEAERQACHQLCRRRGRETGEGTCSLVCLDQLGSPRESYHGCSHAVEVFLEEVRTAAPALKKVFVRFVGQKLTSRGRVSTYAASDGKRIDLDEHLLEKVGLIRLLREHGYEMIDDSLPVYQRGRKVGTVPGGFNPTRVKSKTFLYDPRPGDFTRREDHWEASPSLCPGDFDAIPGFVRCE